MDVIRYTRRGEAMPLPDKPGKGFMTMVTALMIPTVLAPQGDDTFGWH